MSGLARSGVRAPESALAAWLRRNDVTPEEAYKMGAGEPCPHCGTPRGGVSRYGGTGGEITRGTGYITRVS